MRGDTDKEDISKSQSIIFDDLVLQSGDDCNGSIEGIAEKEVACAAPSADTVVDLIALHTDKIEKTLFKTPNLRDGTVQLPKSYHHNVHIRRQRLARSPLFQNEPGYS